jgi:thiamine-phosphate pyrophosphorylase
VSDKLRKLSECQLYGILDLSYIDNSDAVSVADAMIEGGVDLIQLRGKERPVEELVDLAAALHELTARSSTPLIVNDHAEIAVKVPVEGVHVGQDDAAVAAVRRRVDREILVGKSTHSINQALAGHREAADYLGFGPIFATPTKPDYRPIGLKEIEGVHRDVVLPIFCIGGIKMDNLKQVITAGARRVAIVSGLLKAVDIAEYARTCKNLLNSAI